MKSFELRRNEALRVRPERRTIEEWIITLYGIYQKHTRTCGPYDIWLQVVNDGSQLGETIRRQIIRSKFSMEPNVYTQLARLFCRISSFLGKYVYDIDPQNPPNDSINNILLEKPLNDFIGGEERYEKWLLLKYPNACPTCGNLPCICASYRNIMENRDTNVQEYDKFWEQHIPQFIENKKELTRINGGKLNPKTEEMYKLPIDEWVRRFYALYASGHTEISLEAVGFHFLEEIGEVSDGILCLDELFKYKINLGVYKEEKIDLIKIIEDKAKGDPRYIKFLEEYTNLPKDIDGSLKYMMRINMTLIKEELADVFSWLCAILNKIESVYPSWNPDGKTKLLSDALHERFLGDLAKEGCPYCGEPICKPECVLKSTVRKSIEKRNQKLEHRLFS